ncbi:MAG TPA: hypothetical protein VF807_00085 [Ktedonobacterales bacterium]
MPYIIGVMALFLTLGLLTRRVSAWVRVAICASALAMLLLVFLGK